jgi:hypothetical protein
MQIHSTDKDTELGPSYMVKISIFCLLLQIREGSWEPTNIPLEDRLKQV